LCARLDYKGPGAGIDKVYHHFYFAWLPQSGLQPDDRTDYMVFHGSRRDNRPSLDISIYIGVRAL
jgi:DNA gyrase inhibitor GyrI